MRYLKVLLLVLLLFVAMLFFVQNQHSFSNDIVLTLNLLFLPEMRSVPLPMYGLMLICFTFGGVLVLLMLMWDRISLSARCSTARSKAISLSTKLEKVENAFKQHVEKANKREAELQAELKEAKEKLLQQKTAAPAENQ